MKWTADQQKVIDARKRNILVSAAAGSGKTAVLVERIIQMVTDKDHPIDIDRLLIVTFTNAAAGEMRERIGLAIEKKLLEEPTNEHLQKQMTLIHTAQITTIHSFCLNVIRNHFNEIDLDPSFRVGDEAELQLIKADVIANLLEEEYEAADDDFLNFVEWYAGSKTDVAIEGLILSIYDASMSYPWPEEWLENQSRVFMIKGEEELEELPFMRSLLEYVKSMIDDLKHEVEMIIKIAEEPDGPVNYIDALQSDIELYESLSHAQSYKEYYERLGNLKFATLSRKKSEGVSEQKKEQVKNMRDTVKKKIKKIADDFFYQSLEDMVKDMNQCAPIMQTLVRLTLRFMEEFKKVKEEKVMIDFSDFEHMALKILVKREDGVIIPTNTANELAEFYEEIMIDEYQDSNLVQETILNSVSKVSKGQPNIFMVGDVKQSIYRFRLARPELFMEKYESYTLEDSLYQRIDLHKNFRSRGIVLDYINYIFEQIMTKKLGNIAYDADAALYEGALFPQSEGSISTTSELILVTSSKDEVESNFAKENTEGYSKETTDGLVEITEEEEEEEYGKKELEAKAIAKRIKEFTSEETGLLVATKQGEYRTAQYKDIVILLRTMTNWADVFVDTLLSEGIPAHADTATGYFQTLEIKTILNLLRVIDNPLQDIPFAAVLHSFIGGFSSEEMALLRAFSQNDLMYDVCDKYVEYGENTKLKEKTKIFIEKLSQFREMQEYLSVHELIIKILEQTHYYEYISAMPAGNVRKANVDMLIQKAIAFESTSYSGLFQFIRYMDRLKQYNIDFGEASVSSENDNTVRIISIHKSKGLEFPVVFVAGMGKTFNTQDSKKKVVVHPDLGLGPEVVDLTLRVKAPTILKKVIQQVLLMESLGEELRVLYVALTRAKEKLIITGYVDAIDKLFEKFRAVHEETKRELSFLQLTSAKCFLDYIIPALMRQEKIYQTFIEYLQLEDNQEMKTNEVFVPCTLDIVTPESFVALEKEKQIQRLYTKQAFYEWNTEQIYDETIREKIHEILEYSYPYQKEVELPAKVTVSQLKRLGQENVEEDGDLMYDRLQKQEDVIEQIEIEEDNLNPISIAEDALETGAVRGRDKTSIKQQESGDFGSVELYIPKFARSVETVSGASRGTLYHKVLETLSLSDELTPVKIRANIKELITKQVLPEEALQIVNPYEIYEFTKSNLAKRMLEAKDRGSLFKEQQFVMGISAKEINKEFLSDEIMLVQGVIDAFFEEDGELVLVDYKTDRVWSKDPNELVLRYQIQLDYYKRALEQITNKVVKEKIIYSFALKTEIKLQ